MTQEQIIQTIADHFLCVRRLPFEVTSLWNYREGDENKIGGLNGKPIYLEGGKILNAKREIVTGLKDYPEDRKFIKETRYIEKGGWWYVKKAIHTGSTIRFNREHDKFFAPTLEEAIQLYLNSL